LGSKIGDQNMGPMLGSQIGAYCSALHKSTNEMMGA
jgi:hypothetical protein